MFKRFYFLLALIFPVLATNNCVTPTNCYVKCSNVNSLKLNLLKNTNWIAVPWDDGSCYFHNTLTKENKDEFPKLNIDI